MYRVFCARYILVLFYGNQFNISGQISNFFHNNYHFCIYYFASLLTNQIVYHVGSYKLLHTEILK